jgi:hypothetical protein
MSSDLDLIYGTPPKPPPPSDGGSDTGDPASPQTTKKPHVPVKSSTQQPAKTTVRPSADTMSPRNRDTEQEAPSTQQASKPLSKPARLHASNHASMLALPPESLEAIRKSVKNPGKADVLYVRVSKEEKEALEDVKFTYKRQSIKTSENEVARIAINALLEDYKTNGANSLLAKILESLHA